MSFAGLNLATVVFASDFFLGGGGGMASGRPGKEAIAYSIANRNLSTPVLLSFAIVNILITSINFISVL